MNWRDYIFTIFLIHTFRSNIFKSHTLRNLTHFFLPFLFFLIFIFFPLQIFIILIFYNLQYINKSFLQNTTVWILNAISKVLPSLSYKSISQIYFINLSKSFILSFIYILVTNSCFFIFFQFFYKKIYILIKIFLLFFKKIINQKIKKIKKIKKIINGRWTKLNWPTN